MTLGGHSSHRRMYVFRVNSPSASSVCFALFPPSAVLVYIYSSSVAASKNGGFLFSSFLFFFFFFFFSEPTCSKYSSLVMAVVAYLTVGAPHVLLGGRHYFKLSG